MPKLCLDFEICLCPVKTTVIVDTKASLNEFNIKARDSRFVIVQHYNHEMRSYTPIVSL